jgi:cyclohexa-1,5-dienecarbonyl-CoA hydratase
VKFIRSSVSGGIATIRLQRPPVNVLNLAMIQEIGEALKEIQKDETVHALVFRGEGACFSAGVDIQEHLPYAIPETLRAFHDMVRAIYRLPFPTISAVHSHALGGGFELVLTTDLAIATPDANLGCPEITLAVFAPVAVVVLNRRIGDKRAHEMLLTGRTLSAADAERWGLINRVVPNLDEGLDELLERIRKLSRPALALCKKVIRATDDLSFPAGVQTSEDLYLREQVVIEDMVEGMKSFLDKRKPRWKHR